MIFCITDEIIIKINIYEKIYIFLLLLIVAINIGFSICGEMKFSDLELLKLEALANPEIDAGGGRGPLRSYGCVIIVNEIAGHHDDGSSVIIPVAYPGEQGNCEGITGSCYPYSCTKIY